jgi:protein LTV1
MGKTKKPFIDKKNSSTYHLLYRSQRDVAEDADGEAAGAGVILWPSPNNNKETDSKVLTGPRAGGDSQAGLVDDYDYDQHLKPISGTGKFLNAATGKTNSSVNANPLLDPRSKEFQDIQEVDRQLESIALNADCMDEDIAAALFGDFEEGDFEELNDDFVLDAAREPEEEAGEGAFDFAAHVRCLIEKATLESRETNQLASVHEQGVADKDFFAKSKPVRGYDDDDDDEYFDENDWNVDGNGVVPKLSDAAERALCDKFNETLAEYDSDDLGECEEEEIVGPLPLEGHTLVEAALDDFLQEKKDDIFIQGARHYMDAHGGGSGFSVLVGTHMVPSKSLDPTAMKDDAPPLAEVLADAQVTLLDPLRAPPAEEIFIDGKSYFSEKMQNPWDCESILSTYSNLDNNPTTIGATNRRRRQKQRKARNAGAAPIEEDEPVPQILLSEKTGLPIGVLASRQSNDHGEESYVSVNKGEAREKEETVEEKKARKLQVKQERQLSRMQKKMMKEAFHSEFNKRATDVLADDVGGRTVFRF